MPLVVGTLNALGAARRHSMFALRHRVFKERLQWSVEGRRGMESDCFDHARAVYVIDEDRASQVKGCVRLLPTTMPYMLDRVFPELLGGLAPPRRPDVWELSRFAIDKAGNEPPQWGFSFRVLDLLAEAVCFAGALGIRRYVFATTVAVQRLITIQGLHAWRLGPTRRVGGVDSVAMVLEVDRITSQALAGPRARIGTT